MLYVFVEVSSDNSFFEKKNWKYFQIEKLVICPIVNPI